MDAATLVSKVKTRLQITTSKHDQYLSEIAPDWLEWVKEETNNSFMVNGEEKIPGPIIQFVAKASEFSMLKAGLKSRSMGSVSYSFDSELPEGIKKLYKPYKKVKFHA